MLFPCAVSFPFLTLLTSDTFVFLTIRGLCLNCFNCSVCSCRSRRLLQILGLKLSSGCLVETRSCLQRRPLTFLCLTLFLFSSSEFSFEWRGSFWTFHHGSPACLWGLSSFWDWGKAPPVNAGQAHIAWFGDGIYGKTNLTFLQKQLADVFGWVDAKTSRVECGGSRDGSMVKNTCWSSRCEKWIFNIKSS